jgi:transcriptional regulator
LVLVKRRDFPTSRRALSLQELEGAVYVPRLFSEDRVPVLHETIRRVALGTLVTSGAGGLIASHVPMLVDEQPQPFGTLIGHVARANPHWRDFTAGTEALAMFLGPEAYISPAWYATKAATGKVVPTWNYAAVHATGPIELVEDEAGLLDIVTRLTATHEAGRDAPWQVSDAPADFVAGMLKAIVGFRIKIARLEGKWKMSQNRPAEDRAGVVDGLKRESGLKGEAVAAAVLERGR